MQQKASKTEYNDSYDEIKEEDDLLSVKKQKDEKKFIKSTQYEGLDNYKIEKLKAEEALIKAQERKELRLAFLLKWVVPPLAFFFTIMVGVYFNQILGEIKVLKNKQDDSIYRIQRLENIYFEREPEVNLNEHSQNNNLKNKENI